MGKLHQIGTAVIRVYANDHLPPHFHVIQPDYQALVEIETLTVLAGELSRRNGKAAIAWARENLKLIRAEWNRINPNFPA